MSYRQVDTLTADQIEPGDLIGIEGFDEPIFVKSVDILSNGVQLNFLDEYGDETLSQEVLDDETVSLFIYEDDE